MSEQEIERAAFGDPNAQPLSQADMQRMRRTPQTKVIRCALGLTQEAFATRYHIPPGTLRDWEQGKLEPDQPARAFLVVIGREPETVSRALEVGRQA